ncbi:MAG: hypothetical protein Q8K82_06695 [Gemmatimonadaceae bacterium]|nr:hypothetical protein [Gemmatimonadaceae bacterium]
MIGIGDEIATNLCFDEPSNACWFATSSGDIRTFRVLGQRVTTLGGGWGDALAVLPSIDGLSVRVVLRTGEVLVAARDNCQRAAATLVAAIGSAAIAAECLDGDALLILDASGTVHRVVPRDGSTSVLVDAGPDATLLAVDRTGGELVVAVHAATWELHRRKLQDGTAVAAPMPLTGALTAMATLPGGGGVLMADDVGQVSKQRWSGATDPFSFSVPGATALCIWHSLVMTAAGSQLMLCEWGRDVTLLTLICGFDPIAVGGWAAMTVDYGALGLGIDEVEWRVREGHAAASVSVARPSAQSADRYEHRVISGIGAPEFRIEAVEKATGKRLATRRFRVVQCWPDARLGPPMAVTGARQVYAKPGWGGGPDAPQNTNIHPAPAEFRIAFAVFRTKDSNSSVRAESRVAHLSDKLTGAGLSVKSYYEEVSHNKTPSSTNPKDPVGTTVKLLGGQVFGPIDLDYSWGDLFEPDDKNNPWSPWSPKGGTWNILGGAFSAHLLDRGLADTVTRLANSVVLSVLPGTDGPYQVGEDKWPAQWSWAFAADAQHYWMEASAPKFTQIPAVVMPAALPSDHATPWTDKEWVSTICHELAHTLGCPDIYKNPTYPAEIL